jgi:hypothetical protein
MDTHLLAYRLHGGDVFLAHLRQGCPRTGDVLLNRFQALVQTTLDAVTLDGFQPRFPRGDEALHWLREGANLVPQRCDSVGGSIDVFTHQKNRSPACCEQGLYSFETLADRRHGRFLQTWAQFEERAFDLQTNKCLYVAGANNALNCLYLASANNALIC